MLQRTVLVPSRNSTRRKKKLHKSPLERPQMSTQRQLVGTQYFWGFSATLWTQRSNVTVWLNEKLEWNRSWSSHPSSLTSTESEISFWLDWCLHCWLFQDTAKILEGGIKVYFPVGMTNYLSEAETCSPERGNPPNPSPCLFPPNSKTLNCNVLGTK